ncbi:hypothetical protein KKF73_04540, partial [Patescibacteria group bacterium]|nr:hypothetical protein [Patescibacteria group bacterium]
KNCFMCTNLRQKQYYIFNKQHTKEEYEAKMKEVNFGSYMTIQFLAKKFEDFREANAIYRSNKNDQCEQVEGHRLFNCKNCVDCFEVEEGRDDFNCIEANGIKDCIDSVSFGKIHTMSELGYEVQESCDFYNFKFCNFCYSKSNLEYCEECHNCENCFGCIGIKNESFRIFNKKFYKEEEYHAMKAKIIEYMKQTGEYGSFFPPEHSPFAYNETEALEYFPAEKEEVERMGFRWKDDMPSAEGMLVDSMEIPDNIKDIQMDICQKVMQCEITGKKFAITEQELLFYKNNNLPLPRRCPNQRHSERLKERHVLHLYDRQCTKCGIDIKSAYPVNDTYKRVYCDKCYFESVY